MKGYVVTLFNIPESVQVANRCIESGKKFNIEVVNWPGVWKDTSMKEMKNEGLTLAASETNFSNINAVVGNFVSQYRIWHKIKRSREPGIVLEHDAVFVDMVPHLVGDIINIGKPSYGRYKSMRHPGIYSLFSKGGGYFPGAHGYYLTPRGASILIEYAKNHGVAPCDLFLNKHNFPMALELYPWIIEAQDSFSTIQKKAGCKAKHNWNSGRNFKLL